MDNHKEMAENLKSAREDLRSLMLPYPAIQAARLKMQFVIAALEADPGGEPLAEGWAGPQRFRRRVVGPMCEPVYDDYIPVWLNYQPKEGKRVAIYGVGE